MQTEHSRCISQFYLNGVSVCGTDIERPAIDIEGIEWLLGAGLAEETRSGFYRPRFPSMLFLCDEKMAYLSYVFQSAGFSAESVFDFFGNLFAKAEKPTTSVIINETDLLTKNSEWRSSPIHDLRFPIAFTVEQILSSLDDRKRIKHH